MNKDAYSIQGVGFRVVELQRVAMSDLEPDKSIGFEPQYLLTIEFMRAHEGYHEFLLHWSSTSSQKALDVLYFLVPFLNSVPYVRYIESAGILKLLVTPALTCEEAFQLVDQIVGMVHKLGSKARVLPTPYRPKQLEYRSASEASPTQEQTLGRTILEHLQDYLRGTS